MATLKKIGTVTTATKAPTGLSIARSGNKFTFSWKIADSNYSDGQTFKYMFDRTGITDGWTESSVGKTTTSKAFTINKANYYPNTSYKLANVKFKVKGKRTTRKVTTSTSETTYKYTVSAFTEKTLALNVPRTPSVSATLNSELSNVTTFSWSVVTSDTDSYMFTDCQWQSVLVKDNKETDGSKITFSSSKLGWLTGTSTSTSYSRTITEDTATLAKGSYTRWFRVRSRGVSGASAWKYTKHVYAAPYQAVVSSATAKTSNAGGFQTTVKWTAASDAAHPIDRTVVEYTIVTPAAGLTCPSGASWTEANISRDTSGADSAVFSIDDIVGVDECLFVRVNTEHDFNTTYGKATLAYTGALSDPSGLSVDSDYSTYRATITATNNSAVEDSVLVVEYRPSKGNGFPIGIIPHGQNSVTVQAPDWSNETAISFAVYAMVGTYKKVSRPDGADSYTITAKTRSKNTIEQGGAVPMPPKNLTVSRGAQNSTVTVTWEWSWKNANGAEISWSDHADAWESTDEPETYIISNIHAAKWNVANLETGKTWYIRVRFFMVVDDSITYGPYTNVDDGAIDLSSAPNKPVLTLSDSIIPDYGSTTASWVYVTTDTTNQAYAEVAVLNNDEYTPIAHVITEQHVTINASELGWATGTSHMLAVRVQSASGRFSEWSDPVGVTIADPLICEISETSLIEETITTEDDPEGREVLSLKEMPFEVTVKGAGDGGITSLVIERAQAYHMDRPDEEDFNGYEGETIFISNQTGDAPYVINIGELIGSLDDGAQYRLVANIKDGLGQTASDQLDFEVHWEHQAVKPQAEIEMDYENFIAKITPILPEGADITDTADIYRLSSDKPELIVQGGTFGQTYVDPYPALGEFGGHRIVLRTANGDYITEDNEIAWLDSNELEVEPILTEKIDGIIDFDGEQIQFYYDTSDSSNWQKDFRETQYLGGSIQGDWNAAVSRSATIASKGITVTDPDMLIAIRKLARYPGICHVRKSDGSSFAANVEVSIDRDHQDRNMLENYSLSITRVDSQGFDGMTLAEWEFEHPEE